MPPAFVLSQDQTLQLKTVFVPASMDSARIHLPQVLKLFLEGSLGHWPKPGRTFDGALPSIPSISGFQRTNDDGEPLPSPRATTTCGPERAECIDLSADVKGRCGVVMKKSLVTT